MSDYLPGKLLMVDENGNEIEVQGIIGLDKNEKFDNDSLSVGNYITNPNISFDFTTNMTLSKKSL